MAHFAKLGVNGKVIAVHGLDNDQMLNADNAEDETVGQQRLQEIHGWPAAMWIQTSYNTRGGVHHNPETNKPDDGTPLRKNFAAIGFTYDSKLDAFYAPKPFSSWTLNETTCQWESPVAYPDDGKIYEWDEDNTEWKEIKE